MLIATLKLVAIILIGYLVGSINLSYLTVKYIHKSDIHKHGSGNSGGTNVARIMGAKWGVTIIILEISKGILLGLFARYIFPADPFSLGEIGPQITGAVAILACLLGNMFPIFLKFKGGKGVTTCAAIVGVLNPWMLVILVAIFLIIFYFSHMVSLGSILASLGMPVSVIILYYLIPEEPLKYWTILLLIVSIMAGMLIYKHSSNIKRILAGTENKFNFGRKKKYAKPDTKK